MKQRGLAFLTILPYLVGLALIASLIWWADRNIATSAGVKKGKAEVKAQWDAANAEARAREAAASAKAAADLAAERKKRRVVVQERTVYVDKIVDRHVYRNQCFDADGLRCIQSAIRGESAAGCKPDGGVPAPAAPDRNDRGGGPALGLILDRTVPGLRGG